MIGIMLNICKKYIKIINMQLFIIKLHSNIDISKVLNSKTLRNLIAINIVD